MNKINYWKSRQSDIISGSLFLLIFSNDEKLGSLSQYASVFLILVAATIGILFRGIKNLPITYFEYTIIFVSILSIFDSIFADTNYFFIYTIIFLMVCACFFVLVRQFSIEELLFISARAYVASISVILIFNWQDFQNSFDLLNNRWEVRFSPFGLHPNLVGFVYGAGAMVLFFCGIVRFGIVRWVYFLSSIFCVLFIFASQARAGLVALFFGVFVSSIISINLWTQKVKNIVFLTAATMLLIITINFEYFYLILADMLDLESDTRGIDSGGTGRFELWQLGVETFLESGWKFFLGGGMRSSSAEFIGFSTESSYITIFLEFGLIGGVLFLFVVYKNILFIAKSLKNPSKNWFLVLFFILSIFIFTVIQSIFNRYMLAIGNQFSLLFLILNFKIATISYENRAK